MVGYIAMAYSFVSHINYLKFISPVKFESKLILFFSASLALLGLSKMLWAVHYPSMTFHDIVSNYFLSGKRLIIAAFIIFYFQAISCDIYESTQKIASSLLLLGLAIMSAYGLMQFHYFHIRAQLNTDSATTAAYQILFYFSTTLAIILRAYPNPRTKFFLVTLALVLTVFLFCLTETRSAILFLPFLLLIFFYKNSNGLSKLQCLSTLAVVFIAAAVMISVSWQRINSISDEVLNYQHDNDTSLGARFSMWDAAVHSLPTGFFGQSPDARYDKLHSYLSVQENSNPEALRNIQYHVHNETLESLTLQGSFGIAALSLFYFSLLMLSCHRRSRHDALSYIAFPLIAFGLFDVIFLQSAAVMTISINLALLVSLKNNENAIQPS